MSAVVKHRAIAAPLLHAQNGGTLIFGLVLLLILSILAVASSNTTSFEFKMSANAIEKTQSFQAAEQARITAEDLSAQFADNLINDPSYRYTCDVAQGLFAHTTDATVSNCTGTPSVIDPAAHAWTSQAGTAAGNNNARYTIEYLGTRTVTAPDNIARRTAAPGTLRMFRITAQGRGPDNAFTYLQTLYVR